MYVLLVALGQPSNDSKVGVFDLIGKICPIFPPSIKQSNHQETDVIYDIGITHRINTANELALDAS